MRLNEVKCKATPVVGEDQNLPPSICQFGTRISVA